MHEGNFTQQIVNSILTELEKHPGGKAQHVKVKVGEMLHLNPDSVLAHFESLTKGTSLEPAKLELEEIPTKVQCRHCHQTWAPEDHHFLYCERCQQTDVDIVSGNQILVDAIDLEI